MKSWRIPSLGTTAVRKCRKVTGGKPMRKSLTCFVLRFILYSPPTLLLLGSRLALEHWSFWKSKCTNDLWAVDCCEVGLKIVGFNCCLADQPGPVRCRSPPKILWAETLFAQKALNIHVRSHWACIRLAVWMNCVDDFTSVCTVSAHIHKLNAVHLFNVLLLRRKNV